MTRNPILLLPAANAAEPSIFLILPDGKAPAKVDPDQLSAFISGLNPKRIIVIGNSAVVPDEYRLAINKKYEVINIDSQSWVLNAITASNLFNTNKIEKQFEKNRTAAKQTAEAPADKKSGASEKSEKSDSSTEQSTAEKK